MSIEDSLKYQRERYNEEADDYARHHGDPINQKYRTRFIRGPLFPFDLGGKKVLDAMAASGIETQYLLSRGADVTGLDISDNNAALYEKLWDRPCLVKSIHETGVDDEIYDVVYICGGLHHVLPLLDDTMKEIHRILKPGGYFCFIEPNQDTWMDHLRRLWYRHSKRFHDSEQAISYPKQMRPYLHLGFEEITFRTAGSIAYLLIGQSMILRVPAWMKRLIYRPLFGLEAMFNCVPGTPRLYLLAMWRKV